MSSISHTGNVKPEDENFQGAKAKESQREELNTYVTSPGHWAQLEFQWGDVVRAVIAGAQGIAEARQAVATGFEQWESHGWQVSAAFQRIWAGERDWEALSEGLDNNSALIVWQVLEGLRGGQTAPVSESSAPFAGAQNTPPAETQTATTVNPSVQGMSPLVAGVVTCCMGTEAACVEVAQALKELAQREDWQLLAKRLSLLVGGERDATLLLEDLDEVDSELVSLALGVLAGDERAAAYLTQLVQAAQEQAGSKASQIQEAFEHWLQSPQGQAAVHELHAQGLDGEPLLMALLERFASTG